MFDLQIDANGFWQFWLLDGHVRRFLNFKFRRFNRAFWSDREKPAVKLFAAGIDTLTFR
jgi:hypothetical protein